MKKILCCILSLVFVLALAVSASAADTLTLSVDADGKVTASAPEGDLLFIASYEPESGRFLGLVPNGGSAGSKNIVLKAIHTGRDFVPQSASRTILVISEPGSSISGGNYNDISITSAVGTSAVSLSGTAVSDTVTVYGGGSLSLNSCKVNTVEVETEGLETISVKGMSKPAITGTYASKPTVETESDNGLLLNVFEANIQLQWSVEGEAEDTLYYLSINEGTPKRLWPYTYNGVATASIISDVMSVDSGSLSLAVSRDSEGKDICAQAENIITLKPVDSLPDVSIVGQEDGSYKFVATDDNACHIFRYKLNTPDGLLIQSFRASGTTNANVAPYTGCTFDVTDVSWAETGRGLSSLTATVSGEKKGVGFTPYDFSGTTATVTDEESFKAAMNKGGTVTLGCDVEITNCRIAQGGDVTLDLNGHTLNVGSSNTLSIEHGKLVTVTDSDNGKAGRISGTAGIHPNSAAALICNGVTVERIFIGDNLTSCRKLELTDSKVYMLDVQNMSNATISGCICGMGLENYGHGVTFHKSTASVSNTVIYGFIQLYANSSVSVEGGTIYDGITVSGSTLSLKNTSVEKSSEDVWFNLLLQNGGTLTTDIDPSSYADSRSTVTDNGNGTWTVTQKQ